VAKKLTVEPLKPPGKARATHALAQNAVPEITMTARLVRLIARKVTALLRQISGPN
jgi:hypothetical protein